MYFQNYTRGFKEEWGAVNERESKMEQKKTPVRVAHVIGKLAAGGVESVVYNYYRHIDHSKYQFDFIIDSDSSCEPKKELIDMGAIYYIVPPYQHLFGYIRELIKLFKENRYLIVHSNMNTLALFSLFAAWVAKVPVRICHNHSTAAKGETKRNVFKYLLRPFSKLFATNYCACSKYAAEWLFGKRTVERGGVKIFNNAIDVEKFQYDPTAREEIRRDLSLQDKFVIGHVGRFCFQKNHKFLIDVFYEITKTDNNAVLLLVGAGELKEQIENYVLELGIKDKVLFLGIRDDVHRIYQAMDVFVFPSHYEGLGLAAVEAQCAGLTVIASSRVPLEAKSTNKIIFLDLDAEIMEWTRAIKNAQYNNRDAVFDNSLDIKSKGKELEVFYDRCLEGLK